MKLVHEFTYTASLAAPLVLKNSPMSGGGSRDIYQVTGGEITGERLNGKILGGGEWALTIPDIHQRIDVRLNAVTDDGAYIYIQYFGMADINDKVMQALTNGTGTDFSDQYFYTNPRIETGDERYYWLNNTFFIGQGRITEGLGVEYRVWRPE